MSSDPFAFNYETAKDLVRLAKRTKNGEFAAELDTSLPVQKANFVWAYVPAKVTCTYDATVKAWIIPGAVTYYPFNIGTDSSGLVQFGVTNDSGVVTGGITCTVYTPKIASNQTAPEVGIGFYLGLVFTNDATPKVLIGLPPKSGSSASGGDAVIELVTDVTCTPTGIQVSKVTLAGADYDTAVIKHFLALSDVTPKSFLGNQGRAVVVNENATALEFGPIVTNDATTFISLTDTPNTYGTTNTYKALTVSSNNLSISFSDNNVTTGFSVTGGGNPNDPAYKAITLVNDQASPGANKYYGTDQNEAKGYHSFSLNLIGDFPAYATANLKILSVNGSGTKLEWIDSEFTKLKDCPSDYTGASGKFVAVENLETGLEFVDLKFTSFPDVPNSYVGHGEKFVKVTLQEDGLEFVEVDFQTIQDDLQTLSLTVDDHETRITQLENKMSVVESDLTQIQSTVSTNSSDISSIQSEINSLQGTVTTIQGDISSLQSSISTITSDVTSIQSSISTLQSDLSNLNSTVGQHTTQITNLESSVSTLESSVSTLESTVSSHTTSISTLESNVTTLQGQVSTLEGTVSTHTGQISTLESGLSTAESNITSIQGDISSIQTDLQTVTTGLTQAQTDISTLQSDVIQNSADIQDILSRLATAESNIQSLQTDLATAQGDIATLQSDLATAQSDISSNYSSLDARITALGG